MKPAESSLWREIDLAWVYSELLTSVQRRTRCIHRARDVVHDSLLRFVLNGRRDEIRQPNAYLRTVVSSVLSDHRGESGRFLSLDETNAGSPTVLPRDNAPSAELLADLQQRLESVQRILDCLPPKCRQVFWLFRIEGRSQPEIARHLGISVNMVERHVMRALLDLRSARDLLVP